MHLVLRVHIHDIPGGAAHLVTMHPHAAHRPASEHSPSAILEAVAPIKISAVGIHSPGACLSSNAMKWGISTVHSSVNLIQHPTLSTMSSIAHSLRSRRTIISISLVGRQNMGNEELTFHHL